MAINLEIKEVSEDQFDEIWPIFREVAKAGDTYPYPMDIDKETAKREWFMPAGKHYNGYYEGRAVAICYITPNKPGLGSHVANAGIMIDKAMRGTGIGQEFFNFICRQAKELGYKAIQANLIASTNKASLKMSKNAGFEMVGTLPNAFHYQGERYVDAYVMFKVL